MRDQQRMRERGWSQLGDGDAWLCVWLADRGEHVRNGEAYSAGDQPPGAPEDEGYFHNLQVIESRDLDFVVMPGELVQGGDASPAGTSSPGITLPMNHVLTSG